MKAHSSYWNINFEAFAKQLSISPEILFFVEISFKFMEIKSLAALVSPCRSQCIFEEDKVPRLDNQDHIFQEHHKILEISSTLGLAAF